MRRLVILMAAFGLAGCNTTSGVVAAGPGLFAVGGSNSMGSTAEAQRQAYSEASAYCAAHGGGRMEVVNQATDSNINGANANVTFRCVSGP